MIIENESLLREYFAGVAKGTKGIVKVLAEKHGMTTQAIYKRLGRARNPKTIDLHQEVERIRKEELWEGCYRQLWEALPEGRGATVVQVKKDLICEMLHFGYSVVDMERLVPLSRATIAHHTNSCEL